MRFHELYESVMDKHSATDFLMFVFYDTTTVEESHNGITLKK